MYEQEPLITVKDLVELTNTFSVKDIIAKRYNNAIDTCFGEDKSNKTFILNKYMNNDRTIIDKYLANDYYLLKQKIIKTRKMCYNRKEIDRDVNTLDFQINLLRSCANHRDFLFKNYELNMSNDKNKRREYNIDLYYDIFDYLIEAIMKEQNELYYGTTTI